MTSALLCEKEVVALVPGTSIHTLRAARYRTNIKNVPVHVRIGGRVLYPYGGVVAWAAANGIALAAPRQHVEIHPKTTPADAF